MKKIKNKNIIYAVFMFILAAFLSSMFYFGYYRKDSGEIIIKGARKIKNLVYYEATVYNPEGDFLPDWIDNAILGKIKELF